MKSFEEEDNNINTPDKWAFNLNYKEIESMLIDSSSLERDNDPQGKTVILIGLPLTVSYYDFLDFLDSLMKKPQIN